MDGVGRLPNSAVFYMDANSVLGGDTWHNVLQKPRLRLIDRLLFVFNIRTEMLLAWKRHDDYDFWLGADVTAGEDDPTFITE